MMERGLSTGAIVGIVVGVVVAVVVPVTIVAIVLGGGLGGVSVSLGTPEETITSMVNTSNAYDADAMYSCLSANLQSQTPIDNLRESMQALQNMNASFTGLQISNVNIHNSIATASASCTYTYTTGGQTYTIQNYTENYLLVKEGGLWKVDNYKIS